MTTFWDAFLPGVAATLIGVFVGLPAAFWLDRHIRAAGEQRQKAEMRKRLVDALTIIVDSLAYNQGVLRTTITVLIDNQVPFEAPLDYSAWDATKLEIVEYLKDPQLKHSLATYFAHLESFRRLFEMYQQYTIGLEAALLGREKIRMGLRDYLINMLTGIDGASVYIGGQCQLILSAQEKGDDSPFVGWLARIAPKY
jgi:hypothetical protein